MPGPFVPEDWKILKASPGGVDKDFYNPKTGEYTFYTPVGMTAEEILRIPGATEYWTTVSSVQKYIEEMAKQKAKYGGADSQNLKF